MLAIMVVGGVASLLGPPFGIAHPLNPIPESALWLAIAIVILVTSAIKRRDPVTWVFEGVHAKQVSIVLASGVLPVLSILGVAQLNYSGNDHLAVVATTFYVVLLLTGVVGGWSRTSRWPLSTLLYSVSLALLLSSSLRGAHLYGWDIQQEFGVASNTIHAGRWVIPPNHDPYASMLSLTVLPAVLHSLVRLRLLAFFQLVIPAILALLPLTVFSTIRSVPRWITTGRATPRPGLAFGVVAGLIVSSVAFSSELVSITRQAMSLTILTALVMVLFDRTMLKRPAWIIVALLVVGISFTHYTTSYLLAGILLCAWLVSLLWSRGWLGTAKGKREKHRYDMKSRNIINGWLVATAFIAAFGWNLGITRNYALTAPASAISVKGAGLATSTGSLFIPPGELERILEKDIAKNASWILPLPDANAVHLTAAHVPTAPGIVPNLAKLWNKASLLVDESLWGILGVALLYGVFRLGRRRSYEYTSDLVGLAVAGLLVGGFLRFSATLAAFYSPERAAIFTAILLAAPVTLFLDDSVTMLYNLGARAHRRIVQVAFSAGALFLVILMIEATGLGALFFGGEPPGSLSNSDLNVQQFTVTTPELATAQWLRAHTSTGDVVQSDLYGHLVLLSEPGKYDLVDEIMPPGVDEGSYIYLSAVNLANHVSQASADNGNDISIYRSNIQFFNQNFFIVYSTGSTRVYH